jgi:serine/threonine protein kinase
MESASTASSSSSSTSISDRLPALDIAARSVLESQVLGVTLASLVAERALEHHWEGLYQYAALRVGSERASELLERLAQALEDGPRDALEPAPGPRARLYEQVRNRIAISGAAPALRGGAASELSRKPPHAVDRPARFVPQVAAFATRLEELRRGLTPPEAELLELHFARGLSVAEVAHVVGSDLQSVAQALNSLWTRAEQALGRRPPSRDRSLAGALLEAFALDPSRAPAPRRRMRPPVLAVGTVIAGRYEIEAKLGSGAFAEVYRARDRDVVDHVVALKILRRPAADERSVQSALRELQLIASVFHPSVVALKDHGWHGGRLWLVMPLYRGETLAARLQRGPVSRSEARAIFEPLAEALATMHRSGVLHQDIKPENVFLATLDARSTTSAESALPESEPRRILPVLLDLGVAAKDAELVLAGTPAYFAPEMAARFAGVPDPAPVGPKADVFSLALTLRRALDPTPDEPVMVGPVDAFVAFRAAHTPAAPAARELRDLKPYFERWLSFAPDRRPSAEALRAELSALTRPAERRERRLRVLRWAVPTVVTVLALFGTTTYVLSREAAIQRLQAATARVRADQARERAANMLESLTVQQARRRELEADVARLEREYQSSKMTREQLATHLAQAEGELEIQRAALAQRAQKQADDARAFREQRALMVAELEAVLDVRNELAQKLNRAGDQLEGERARSSAAAASNEQLREQLASARKELEQAREREREAQSQIALLRQALLPPASMAKRAAPK